VLKNGNTGIGTSTPSQKLHVNGNVSIDSSLTVSGKGIIDTFSVGQSNLFFPTQFTRVWADSISMTPNTIAGPKEVTINLPSLFIVGPPSFTFTLFQKPPHILATVRNSGTNDVLVATVKSVSTTQVVILVQRIGATQTWGAATHVLEIYAYTKVE